MTGEVTLRGKVLEIGGVKEKVLAAYRAGLREVILPKSNEKDLRDVPPEVRENMTFTRVTGMDEVLRLALLPAAPRADGVAVDAGAAEPPADAPPSDGAVAPVADGDALTVGEHRRTPGAREGIPTPPLGRRGRAARAAGVKPGAAPGSARRPGAPARAGPRGGAPVNPRSSAARPCRTPGGNGARRRRP
jgi:hypothetical protein